MVPELDRLPRLRRYTLGAQLEVRLLAVLEHLVEAAYTREKRAALARANLDLEMARHVWRLAYELRAISVGKYEHGISLMLALGRQVGGWLKVSRAAPKS